MASSTSWGTRARRAWAALTRPDTIREVSASRRGARLLTRHPQGTNRLIEAGGDPDAALRYDQGGSAYFRSMGGRASGVNKRDLRAMDQDEMIRRAAGLYINDPTAAKIIDRRTNFILGEGFTVTANEPQVQELLDAFLVSPFNRVERKLHGWVNGWRAYGELPLRIVPAEVPGGPPTLAFISPDTIREVHTVLGNCEEPELIQLKDEGGHPGPIYPVIRASDEVLPDGTRLLGGEVLYVKANALPDMTRGVSDLWRLADLIEGHSSVTWDLVERAGLLNTLVAMVTKHGASDDELKDAQEDYGREVPKGGRLIVKNETEEWDFLTPDFASQDAAGWSDLVLALIANGADFPLFWLNGTMDPNRASAEQMTGPVLKGLAELQRELAAWLTDLLTFVVHQAIREGVLSPSVDRGFSVGLPEISTRDLQSNAGAFAQAMAGIIAALGEKLIPTELAQRIILTFTERFGVELTLEELHELMEEEELEDPLEKAMTMVPTIGPPPPPEPEDDPMDNLPPPGAGGIPDEGLNGMSPEAVGEALGAALAARGPMTPSPAYTGLLEAVGSATGGVTRLPLPQVAGPPQPAGPRGARRGRQGQRRSLTQEERRRAAARGGPRGR